MKNGVGRLGLLALLAVLTTTALAGNREERLRARADSRLALMGIEAPSVLLAEADHYAVYGAPTGGFVILAKGENADSADSSDPSVLGYSTTVFDADSLPCGLRWWLDAIDEVLRQGAPRRAATNYSRMDDFLETKWGQDAPYNMLCPTASGYATKTGCMATAMAQVMRYFHWPEHGIGQGGYYLGGRSSRYFHPEAVESYYDWDAMEYQKLSNAPENAKIAVATLMYDCGKACNTFYSTGASFASEQDLLPALINHFQYDARTMRFCERAQYSGSQWLEMVYDELQNRRPIFYSGYLEDGITGHAFVLCGMDEEGKVYVNWGQDGRYDGFYSIDALILSGIDLTHAQTMIIGVQPSGATGVSAATLPAKDEVTKCYTLSGLPATGHHKGIRLVRQGTTVRKVVR